MPNFVRASDVEARPIEWVIPGLIPRGQLTLVAGRPGEGKSLLECWMAAEVTNAGQAVVISNVEDPIDTVQRPRLEAAGAVLKRVHFPDRDEQLFLPRGIDGLERKVKQTRAALVVLDTAARHVTSSIFDPQECQKALGPLARMAERCGCGVILVHHLKGQVSRNAHPLEAIGGARGGLVGTCRFVYVFGRHNGDPDERVLAPAKANNAPDNVSSAFELEVVDVVLAPRESGKLTLEIARLSLTTRQSKVRDKDVVTYSGGETTSERPGRLVIAKDWVITELMTGAKPTSVLKDDASAAGISWGTIRRALPEVGAVKKRVGYGKGGYWAWELPSAHPAVRLAAKAKAAMNGGRP